MKNSIESYMIILVQMTVTAATNTVIITQRVQLMCREDEKALKC